MSLDWAKLRAEAQDLEAPEVDFDRMTDQEAFEWAQRNLSPTKLQEFLIAAQAALQQDQERQRVEREEAYERLRLAGEHWHSQKLEEMRSQKASRWQSLLHALGLRKASPV